MVKLVVVDISDVDESFEKYLTLSTGHNTTGQMSNKKIQHEIGVLLSKYLVSEKLNVDINKIKFKKNQYGKPYYMNCNFSVSHSKNLVICSISDFCVGVDVEYIKPRNFNIANRCFSEEECLAFKKVEEKDKLKYFYKIWTIKESYVKALGLGLLKSLRSFTVVNDNSFGIYVKEDLRYKFRMIDKYKDYSIAVCYHKNDSNFSCEFYSCKEFVSRKLCQES